MKKYLIIAVAVLFCLSAVSAFAADATKGSHRPASKSIDDPMFQAASEHISQWGKSSEIVKGESLRTDVEKLDDRRGPTCKKMVFE